MLPMTQKSIHVADYAMKHDVKYFRAVDPVVEESLASEGVVR